MKKKTKKAVFNHVCFVHMFDGEIMAIKFPSAKKLGLFVVDILTKKQLLEIAQIVVPTAKVKVSK